MINLNEVIYLQDPAKKIEIDSIILGTKGAGSCQVNYSWLSNGNAVLQSGSISLTGGDLQTFLTARVSTPDVNVPLITVLKKILETRLLTMLNIAGTLD
jgi:hypothetical protein